jgi:hypothetical protein
MTGSSPAPSSLLLFTTSQTPLEPRYPHPEKPKLLIPSFIHASLHSALDREPPSFKVNPDGVLMIPDPSDRIDDVNGVVPPPGPITQDSRGGEASFKDAEITVKMYLVTPASHSIEQQKAQVARALRNLVHYKARDKRWNGRAAQHIDTFLLGWKGIEYTGDERVEQENVKARAASCGSAKLASRMAAEAEREEDRKQKAKRGEISEEEKEDLVELWQVRIRDSVTYDPAVHLLILPRVYRCRL